MSLFDDEVFPFDVSELSQPLLEGSDPALKAEAVLFTAHWDHLGIGRPVFGDSIYNGAADNATGCAILMELARAWSAQAPRPKRTAIFLAVTAEEKGLLGSRYYAEHPLIPLSKTALNLNFDKILPLGVPKSVVVNGAERTTAFATVKAAAKANRLEIEDLIGFFVNTLALRARPRRHQSFSSLLASVRETALGAYAHQDLPFEKLIAELGIPRDLSRQPLVQALFAVQNSSPTTIRFLWLSAENVPVSVLVMICAALGALVTLMLGLAREVRLGWGRFRARRATGALGCRRPDA